MQRLATTPIPNRLGIKELEYLVHILNRASRAGIVSTDSRERHADAYNKVCAMLTVAEAMIGLSAKEETREV